MIFCARTILWNFKKIKKKLRWREYPSAPKFWEKCHFQCIQLNFMKNWRKESALTFLIFACFHCFFDLRKWVVGKKSIKFFRAFKMELYLASIQKIRALSFLQFFLKFKILASVFDVAPWFFALEQFCHICVKIFFKKYHQHAIAHLNLAQNAILKASS